MKKKEAELLTIAICYRCACGVEGVCVVDAGDFSACTQDNGEHGHVEVAVHCLTCNKYNTLFVNRW